MGARVSSRESPVHTGMIDLPSQKEVAKAVTMEVARPTRDQVEQFRATENDGRAGTAGLALERYFGGMLATIPEGDKRELELSVDAGEDFVGSGKMKFAVEHKDGQYVVTVQGSAAAGVGGMTPATKATLTAGATGSATFRFGSREEAADALSALVQAIPETGVTGPGGTMVGRLVRDDDALSRAFHAAGRLQAVELGDQLSAELSASAKLGSAAVKAKASGTWTIGNAKLDLAKGELVLSTSLDAGGGAKLSRDLDGAGLLKASTDLANLKCTAALEQHFPLSLQDIERIQKGGVEALKQIAADSARHSRTEAVLQAAGNLAGLEIEAERRGPPSQILQEVAQGRTLQAGNWSFKGFKVGGEVSAELDAGVVKVKGTVKDRLTVVSGKGELVPFVQRAHAEAQAAQQQERAVSAQRALAAH